MKPFLLCCIVLGVVAFTACGGGTVAGTTPPPPTYTIGGTVSGLHGTVVLVDNGGNSLPLTANGTFKFPGTVNSGASYNVTVNTQPSSQTCDVTNGSGMATSNVTNVQVTCTNVTTTYTIGGTASGLTGTLVLLNNASDSLSIATNGSFVFKTAISSGANYNVTVQTPPSGQTCAVANGSGKATSNVTNIQVTCTTATFTIGGSVSALAGTGLVLQNNGGNNLTITANGPFTFSTSISSGSTYNVTVLTQPSGQTCTVANGSGTATSNVMNVQVMCSGTVTYTIGGTVSGLTGTVVLQNNGGNNLSLSANGSFTFSNPVSAGSTYNVSVLTLPATQSCSVANGSGTANSNITNIQVTCTTLTYTIGGTVSGLTGSGLVLQNNGGNNLAVSASGSFTFSTKVNAGSTYNVTVFTQPSAQTCTVANGSGTANSNVANVQVTCTTNSGNPTISVNVSGLGSGQSVQLSDDKGDVLTFNSNTTLIFASTYTSGANYAVNVSSQPSTQACTPTYFAGTISSDVTLTATCASGATRPLGTVSGVSSVACKGSISNGVCQQMTVSCPGVPNVLAFVKTNSPSGTSKGTVTYGTGTDGNGLYDSIFTFGDTAVQNVLNAGYTTVQISWGTPFNSSQPNGWVQGPGGVLAAACRYATVTKWIYDNVQNNTSLPMCATANSGGAGALAYALSQYGSSNILSMAEVTSGPPTGRLDWGCGCQAGKVAVSCGATTTVGTCFGAADSPVWDSAYSPSLNPGNPYCSNAAVHSVLPPGGLDYFLGDSAEAPGATYNFPNTFVNLVFGGQDTSSAIPIGQDWFNHITSTSKTGQECIADAPHSIANAADGAAQIATDIINHCTK
jgi:hypothetical protein